MIQFLEQIGPLASSAGRPFDVRLYRCLPSINYFRIDDDIFWGPYLIPGQSRNMPTFIVRRGGILFDRLTLHFQQIWDRFSRVPDADSIGTTN